MRSKTYKRSDWKEWATIKSTGGSPEYKRIGRVLARFVELSDGSKWDHDGRRYPKNLYGWSWDRARPATAEDLRDKDLRDQHTKLARRLKNRDWAGYTLEQLEAIEAAVKAAEGAA